MYIVITSRHEYFHDEYETIFDGPKETEYIKVQTDNKEKIVKYYPFIVKKTITNLDQFKKNTLKSMIKVLEFIFDMKIKSKITLERYNYEISFTLEYGCPLYVKNPSELSRILNNIPNGNIILSDPLSPLALELLEKKSIKYSFTYGLKNFNLWFTCNSNKNCNLEEPNNFPNYEEDSEEDPEMKKIQEVLKDIKEEGIFYLDPSEVFLREVIEIFEFRELEDKENFYYERYPFTSEWLFSLEKDKIPTMEILIDKHDRNTFLEVYSNLGLDTTKVHFKKGKVIFPVTSYKMYQDIYNKKTGFIGKIEVQDGLVDIKDGIVYVDFLNGDPIILSDAKGTIEKIQKKWNKGDYFSEWGKNYFLQTGKISRA